MDSTDDLARFLQRAGDHASRRSSNGDVRLVVEDTETGDRVEDDIFSWRPLYEAVRRNHAVGVVKGLLGA